MDPDPLSGRVGPATQSRSRLWTTRRRWSSRIRGTVKNDQGTVTVSTRSRSPSAILSRPSQAAWAFASSIQAMWCRPTARPCLRLVTQIQPITVVFTVAEDSLGRNTLRELRERERSSRWMQPHDHLARARLLRGTLLTSRQPDRHHHWNASKPGPQFANKDGLISFPISL